MEPARRVGWAPAALVGVAVLLMWPVILGGQAFLPADLLRYAAPWSSLPNRGPLFPWNPLLYDSIGQFYPWRSFAAATLRTGLLPLWNPYAFCGAPFVANSQSAVFYPPNLLYCLLPGTAAVGLIALLHLALAGAFMWLLVRHLTRSDAAGFVAGCAYMLSGWQVAWLHLPTFLDTSCWIPLAVLLAMRAVQRPTAARAAGLGLVLGMMLLAGHLQVAFYGLLAVALAGALELWHSRDQRIRAVVTLAAAFALGFLLSAPQVVPALELSRRSHRATKPSPEGYAAYVAYGVGTGALGTLAFPTFLGEPGGVLPYRGLSRGGAPFNYAEGALYVGVTTLLLAGLAFGRRKRLIEPASSADASRAFLFAALGVLALLMAFATPIDALLYFGVPGFGQSGSPGRALVLWAFAVSGLAGIGAARLLRHEVDLRKALVPLCVTLAGLGLALAIGIASPTLTGQEDAGMYLQDAPRQLVLLLLAAGTVLALAGRAPYRAFRAFPAALVAADLLAAGVGLNPTAAPGDVYPAMSLIGRLREAAGHDRIMPVNTGWSFAGPKAVLPPNGAMVFGLRDVQGYDSLFPGAYKQWMNRLAGRDSSPPEVGNMVFARNPLSPLAPLLGVRCVVSREPIPELSGPGDEMDGAYVYDLPDWPGRVRMEPLGSLIRVQWLEDGPTRVRFRAATPGGLLVLADQNYPGWRVWVDGRPRRIEPADDIFRAVELDAGEHELRFAYQPQGFRVGLYLGMLALAAVVGLLAGRRRVAAAEG